MTDMTLIGQIGRELYTNFILWSDGHGRHYAYEGVVGKARIRLLPVLIDGVDKAQNRYYQMSILYTDDRPDVNRLVKYYFVVKTCTQNHLNFNHIEWSRRIEKPDSVRRPKPRKGPEKADCWYLVMFQYQGLVKPVLTRSPDRAWHTEYADSPVPIEFKGYAEYTPIHYEALIQTIEPSRDHGNWFVLNPSIQTLLEDLNFTTELD